MSHDQVVVDTQFSAQLSNLILEELAKRLDELQTSTLLHTGRKASNVVVGLDGGTGALEGKTLDYIRIQSTLKEPPDLGTGVLNAGLDLRSLRFKDVDEFSADELALLLGVRDTRKTGQEVF